MQRSLTASLFCAITALTSLPASAQTAEPAQPAAPAVACGGDLAAFLDGVKAEAMAQGISATAADEALAGARIDNKVLSMDRGQGVFRQTFLEFSKRVVSQARLDIGRKKLTDLSSVFARAEQEFGVPGPIIAAFWAMETDFGAVQGDFNEAMKRLHTSKA